MADKPCSSVDPNPISPVSGLNNSAIRHSSVRAIAVAVLGYLYYDAQQSKVKIDLPGEGR
jgi:hypothetical protein